MDTGSPARWRGDKTVSDETEETSACPLGLHLMPPAVHALQVAHVLGCQFRHSKKGKKRSDVRSREIKAGRVSSLGSSSSHRVKQRNKKHPQSPIIARRADIIAPPQRRMLLCSRKGRGTSPGILKSKCYKGKSMGHAGEASMFLQPGT